MITLYAMAGFVSIAVFILVLVGLSTCETGTTENYPESSSSNLKSHPGPQDEDSQSTAQPKHVDSVQTNHLKDEHTTLNDCLIEDDHGVCEKISEDTDSSNSDSVQNDLLVTNVDKVDSQTNPTEQELDSLQVNKDIAKESLKVEDTSSRDSSENIDHNSDQTEHQNTDDPHVVKSSSTVEAENNSTIVKWLRYILDPLLEEFKEGIYPKLGEVTNGSLTNKTNDNSNETKLVNDVNTTVLASENATDLEATNETETGKKTKFQCIGRNVTDNTNATVKLVTTARLLQMLNFDKNSTENVTDCLLVMFYAPWCHFCAKTAPHFNALARAFPQLDVVAVDTAQFSNLLARFGTVSVPNILIFHQSRAAVKYNQTERTFDNFVTFVTNTTGLEPNATVNVTDIDYEGPVSNTPTNEPDYLLLVSWLFVILCSSCMFIKSTKGQQWINRVRVLWQEHQHID